MLRVVAVLLFTSMCTPFYQSNVHIEPEVLAFLASIQQQFEIETALCLVGYSRQNTLYVHDIKLAGVIEGDSARVKFGGCTERNAIGWAHNHPKGVCAFSDTDLKTTRREGSRIAIVSCDGGFAWVAGADTGKVTWPW